MRRVALLAVAAALMVAGCASKPRVWVTPPHHALMACASVDCGPYAAALNWGTITLAGRTGYFVTLNGTQVANVTASPYTLIGLDCGTTFTLGVQAHDASSGTSAVFSSVYTSPPCPSTTTAFNDPLSGSSIAQGVDQWTIVGNTIGNSNTFQCDAAAQAGESGGFLTETVAGGSFTCPGPTGGNGGIGSCAAGTCSTSFAGAEVQSRDQAFKYGTLKFTAKVEGDGSPDNGWPAIWMLGDYCQHPQFLVAGNDPSPCSWHSTGSEEIDIAEWTSGTRTEDTSTVWANGGVQGPCTSGTISDASANTHNYELDWSSSSIAMKIDGTTQCSFSGTVTSLMFPIISAQMSGTSAPSQPTNFISNFSITPAGPDIASSANWPSISGSTVHGSTLTASNGTWTGSPSGFTYQWMTCNGSGASCSFITSGSSCSATPFTCSSTYTTTAGEVGDTIQVLVVASNASGATQYGSSPTAGVS